MATICLYQDTCHDEPFHWIKEIIEYGYISRRNDGITELRINGFSTVKNLLFKIKPFILFKRIQVEAMIKACGILENNLRAISKDELLKIVELIIVIQNANYSSHYRKTREEILKILNLTP